VILASLADNLVGLGLAVALVVYLVVVLIAPERF
jgi:K+-transporting ATPase KdpF subunit